ncbi:Cytochrome oxidase assembly [Sorochytrium milnesiophthora]
MEHFERRPLGSGSAAKSQITRRPFLFLGLPLIVLVVGGSFALAHLTQTKVDYNQSRVQHLSSEEAVALESRKKKKKFDLREEYFVTSRFSVPLSDRGGGGLTRRHNYYQRLQTGLDTENWDMVPIDKSDDYIPLSVEEHERVLNERFQQQKAKAAAAAAAAGQTTK